MKSRPQDINSTPNNKLAHEESSFDRLVRSLDDLPTGFVQVVEGEHIGRIIILNRSLTRLGLSGSTCAVIANRGDEGYFLTPLEGDGYPLVNGKPTGDATIKLTEGAMIEIDGIVMRFHQGTQPAADISI